MWHVEKKQKVEEPTFHELIDDKQGCPTGVRRANTLLSNKNQARDRTKSEHKSSLSAQNWHKSRAYFQFQSLCPLKKKAYTVSEKKKLIG